MNNLSFGAQFYIWNGGKTLVLEQTSKGNDVDALKNLVTSKETPDKAIDTFIKQTEITEAQNQTGSGPTDKKGIARVFFDSFNRGELVDIDIQHVNDRRDEVKELPMKSFFRSYHILTAQKPVQEYNEQEKEDRTLLAANRIRKNTERETMVYLTKKGNLFDINEGELIKELKAGEYPSVNPYTTRKHNITCTGQAIPYLIYMHSHPIDASLSFPIDVQVGIIQGTPETLGITPSGYLTRLKIPKLNKLPIVKRGELNHYFNDYDKWHPENKLKLLQEAMKDENNRKKCLEIQNKLEIFDKNYRGDTFMMILALKKFKEDHKDIDLRFTIEKLPDNIDDPDAKELKTTKIFDLDD